MGCDVETGGHAEGGRGVTDRTISTLELGWQSPIDFLSLGLGVSTDQPPKTADNGGFRVPFVDLISPSSNRTSYYLDVVGSF